MADDLHKYIPDAHSVVNADPLNDPADGVHLFCTLFPGITDANRACNGRVNSIALALHYVVWGGWNNEIGHGITVEVKAGMSVFHVVIRCQLQYHPTRCAHVPGQSLLWCLCHLLKLKLQV
jgi:hypothetical protein